MAYDPNQQYQQPPQYPPPGPQNYQQQPGYPPPGYGQPPVAQKSLIAQQLGPSSIGIDPNIAGALCYFWLIGLIFFLIEKQNKFVRFHAIQSLFYGVGFWIVAILLGIFDNFFFGLGLLSDLLWVIWVVGAIYAAVQAYNGKWFQLPVVGSMAYNNAMSWNPGMPGGPMGGPPPNTMYPPQGGYPPQQPGNYPQSGPGYPPQQPPQWPPQ